MLKLMSETWLLLEGSKAAEFVAAAPCESQFGRYR